MNNNNYVNFRYVNLYDTGLIVGKKYKTNIEKFCDEFDIKNLEELFNFVDIYGVSSSRIVVANEIRGVIELLRYKYLGYDLKINDILVERYISGLIYSYDDNFYNLKIARRLGLSQEEAKKFVLFAESSGNNQTWGNLLLDFYNSFVITNKIMFDNDISKNKFYIIIKYYNNKIDDEKLNNVITLDKLYGELCSLCTDLLSVNEKISLKKSEIDEYKNKLQYGDDNNGIKRRIRVKRKE